MPEAPCMNCRGFVKRFPDRIRFLPTRFCTPSSRMWTHSLPAKRRTTIKRYFSSLPDGLIGPDSEFHVALSMTRTDKFMDVEAASPGSQPGDAHDPGDS